MNGSKVEHFTKIRNWFLIHKIKSIHDSMDADVVKLDKSHNKITTKKIVKMTKSKIWHLLQCYLKF